MINYTCIQTLTISTESLITIFDCFDACLSLHPAASDTGLNLYSRPPPYLTDKIDYNF